MLTPATLKMSVNKFAFTRDNNRDNNTILMTETFETNGFNDVAICARADYRGLNRDISSKGER